jgi:hypothetical protein
MNERIADLERSLQVLRGSLELADDEEIRVQILSAVRTALQALNDHPPQVSRNALRKIVDHLTAAIARLSFNDYPYAYGQARLACKVRIPRS